MYVPSLDNKYKQTTQPLLSLSLYLPFSLILQDLFILMCHLCLLHTPHPVVNLLHIQRRMEAYQRHCAYQKKGLEKNKGKHGVAERFHAIYHVRQYSLSALCVWACFRLISIYWRRVALFWIARTVGRGVNVAAMTILGIEVVGAVVADPVPKPVIQRR